MIYFGSCIGYPKKLAAHARPGLTYSMGDEPYVHLTPESNGVDIFPIYAGIMRAARTVDAEMLVLLHDDLEFRDPELAAKLRYAFTDPSVAIVGLIGARGVRNLRWWEGSRRGRVEDLAFGLHEFPFGDVDSLDGMMLALSPWALENLTLEDIGYSGFHGYDAELCFQARRKGKRVVAADIRAFHHSKGGYAGDPEAYMRAEQHFAARWIRPLEEMTARVRNAGTDSLERFGNGYTLEGGLYLQQNPEEFAQLAMLLKERGPGGSYLEIGSASGGACRFLNDHCDFDTLASIDDGKHPRAVHQRELLPLGTARFVGDSHGPAAGEFIESIPHPSVAFIDGDHSYDGVTQDIALVLSRCKPGALLVLHDIEACEGVKRAWRELLASKRARAVAEFIGTERPLGIGVAEVLAPVEEAWVMLRRPPSEWDLAAMYDAHRGSPVSPTPLVHMMIPSYREGYDIVKRTEPSRAAIIEDLNTHGIDVMRTDVNGDSLVQRMRQRAMHLFLKSNATHLLWSDLDIEALDPTCVRRMLATGHDVVAGACPFKDTTRRVVCNLFPDTAEAMVDGAQVALPGGCLEVQDAGTGFMLVSRKALLALMQAHPELLHWSQSTSDRGEPLWALYDTGVVDGIYQSEDYMFCRHWQALGGKVYVHVPSTFRHYGLHGFEGSLMAQLGLEARA